MILRKLVNQDEIILFMATIGLSYFLIGFGEFIFGGEPKSMITEELGLPTGSTVIDIFNDIVILQHIDIAAAIIAAILVVGLAIFFSKTRIGRALRAVADDHQAALSVGISLNQIWAIVWFASGIVALATGIMWGARSDVSFALQIVALKALPVLDSRWRFTSVPGAIVGGLIVGFGEKLFEVYWGGLLGGGVEGWFAYVLALIFLMFQTARPVRRKNYREGVNVLPRSRTIQNHLSGRSGDLPDPAGPHGNCRDLAHRICGYSRTSQ